MRRDHLFQDAGAVTGAFIVEIDGIPVGRFTEVEGLEVNVEVEEYAEGGMNGFSHKLPTRITYPNLVLKRGVTWENLLYDWFDAIEKVGAATEGEVERHTLGITMISATGKRLRSWTADGAIPVRWTGPSLANSQDDVPTEELEVAHHGFEAENH